MFRCLTPAEMMERRRQGLCYNCDEPYVRGHQCQRLFFLEVSDYTSDGEDGAAAGDADALPAEEAARLSPCTPSPASARRTRCWYPSTSMVTTSRPSSTAALRTSSSTCI